VALFDIGVSANAYFAGVGSAVCGAAMAVMMTLGTSIRQSSVPDELTRRAGAARLTAMSAWPAGVLSGGWPAHLAGLCAPFLPGPGSSC
jgi:hypothetical protein